MIFNVEKTFMAYVCQMCGKYTKTKLEIIKPLKPKKKYIIFSSKSKIVWFQTFFLEKANPTSIDSFVYNPNPLIRNVSAQPFSTNIDIPLKARGPETSGRLCRGGRRYNQVNI